MRGWGGGSDTQLVGLLSHRLFGAQGLEQGWSWAGEEVRVIASWLSDGAHLVLLENDLVPWVQQGCEQQEKHGLSAQYPTPHT